MIISHFVLLLFSLASCNQADVEEYKLQKSFPVSLGNVICINKKDCFYFDTNSFYCDNGDFCEFMYYSHGKNSDKQMVDTIELMPYDVTLHSFKSEKSNSYVILREIETEFVPVFIAYYLKDGKIEKIGEFIVYEPCETCDRQEYSTNKIRIFQKNEEIIFRFSKGAEYEDENNSWTSLKGGNFKISFKIDD